MPRTLTRLRYHLVFGTRDHKPLIPVSSQKSLDSYIAGIINQLRAVTLAISSAKDHVHVLASIPPSYSISSVMQKIKGSSSHWIKGHWKNGSEFSWQPGYSAFSVSESQSERVKGYLERQEQFHEASSFQEELTRLIEAHHLALDYVDRPTTHTSLKYHLVFVTKNREPLITTNLKRELYDRMKIIIQGRGGEVLEMNGVSDHVHVLARLKPSVPVARVVQDIKGESSRWISDELRPGSFFHWQEGYSAFTVSESLVEKVGSYIRDQELRHDT